MVALEIDFLETDVIKGRPSLKGVIGKGRPVSLCSRGGIRGEMCYMQLEVKRNTRRDGRTHVTEM